MWCVIPAAGRGSRLEPLVRGEPKALLDIEGRSILDRLLERLAPTVTDVCVVVGESGAAIQEQIGSVRHGIRIHYAVQPQPLGVAEAVCRSRTIVSGSFLVVMGDVYYEERLAPYIERWRLSNAAGAVLVEPVVDSDRGSMGLVRVAADRVVEIEKAAFTGQTRYRACGLMILPDAAFAVCRELRPGSTDELELEDVVARLIRDGFDFLPIRYQGWRRNINSLEDLRLVETRLRLESAELKVNVEWDPPLA